MHNITITLTTTTTSPGVRRWRLGRLMQAAGERRRRRRSLLQSDPTPSADAGAGADAGPVPFPENQEHGLSQEASESFGIFTDEDEVLEEGGGDGDARQSARTMMAAPAVSTAHESNRHPGLQRGPRVGTSC